MKTIILPIITIRCSGCWAESVYPDTPLVERETTFRKAAFEALADISKLPQEYTIIHQPICRTVPMCHLCTRPGEYTEKLTLNPARSNLSTPTAPTRLPRAARSKKEDEDIPPIPII